MIWNITPFLIAFGYVGFSAVIFAETGIFIGLFLPGDSLLFTAGLLASMGYFQLGLLIFLGFVSAVCGDAVGYAAGYKFGPKVFTREKSLFLNKDYIRRSEEFFGRHGGKAIILARFMPIFRTIVPVLAGTGKMKYPRFFIFNIFGAGLWTVIITSAGYYLGKTIPNLEQYIAYIIGAIVLVSLVYPAIYYWKEWRAKK